MAKNIGLPIAEGVAIIALIAGLFAKGNIDQNKIAEKESEIQVVQEQLLAKNDEIAAFDTLNTDYETLQSEYEKLEAENEELKAAAVEADAQGTAVTDGTAAGDGETEATDADGTSEDGDGEEGTAATDGTTEDGTSVNADGETAVGGDNSEGTAAVNADDNAALLAEKDSELAEKESALAEKESALAEKDSEIAEKNSALAEKESAIAEKDSTIAEKDSLLAEKDSTIAEKDSLLAEKDSALAAKDEEFEEKEAKYLEQAAALQEQIATLLSVRSDIIDKLQEEFVETDLPVVVDENTGIITLDSSILFKYDSYALTQDGLRILDEVLPKYYEVLNSDGVKEYVSEVIIEGHTDTAGSYLYNLDLSQKRAFAVADYYLDPESNILTAEQAEDLGKIVTANGKSFSDPILGEDGKVDADASRRVELKFRLLSDDLLTEASKQ